MRGAKRDDVTLQISMKRSDLLDALVDMDREELRALIIAIDERMAEWDFTLTLCDHFDAQRRQYDIESAEDAS